MSQYDIEWLFDDWLDATKRFPIPMKYLCFHKTLQIMGIYDEFKRTDDENGVIYVNDEPNIWQSFSPETAFYALVLDNALEEAKELFELSNLNSEVLVKSFLMACDYRYYMMAKWCYHQFRKITCLSMSKDVIRLETINAAIANELEFAKWLYDLLPSNCQKLAVFRRLRGYGEKEKALRFKDYLKRTLDI